MEISRSESESDLQPPTYFAPSQPAATPRQFVPEKNRGCTHPPFSSRGSSLPPPMSNTEALGEGVTPGGRPPKCGEAKALAAKPKPRAPPRALLGGEGPFPFAGAGGGCQGWTPPLAVTPAPFRPKTFAHRFWGFPPPPLLSNSPYPCLYGLGQHSLGLKQNPGHSRLWLSQRQLVGHRFLAHRPPPPPGL